MFLVFDDRPADSPVAERIWRAHSTRAGAFLSLPEGRCELVVTRHQGQAFMTLRGPETRTTTADCPADGDWVAIRLAPGAFLPRFPPAMLRDRRDVTLPGAGVRSFWLNGSAWEYPTFENADTFLARLVRAGLVQRDPIAGAVLAGDPQTLSQRSVQRRVARATGISCQAFRSIERARYATRLLRRGTPIVDVVHQAGYFDQPHLTHAITRLIGQTPAEIARGERQLAYLYDAAPPR